MNCAHITAFMFHRITLLWWLHMNYRVRHSGCARSLDGQNRWYLEVCEPGLFKKEKEKKDLSRTKRSNPPPQKTMVCNFKNFSSISRYHFIENGPLWAASTSLKTSTKPYASFHLKYCLITVKTVHLQSSLKCLTTSWIYQLAYTVIITGKINLPTLLQAAHLWKYPYVF